MTASTIRRPAATTRLTAVGAIAVAGALLLTGCGDQTDKSTSSGSASAAPLSDKLPADIKSAGVIKVGSDIAYPPMEYKDSSGKTVGVDVDLANALGKQLGVTFQFNNGTFDTLLTGMRAGRYDVAISSMSDTKDRQNGVDADSGKKVGEGVDFVDYFTAGVGIIVKKGNPENISTLADLCGKTVSVQRGSVANDLLKAQKCTSGKITIEAFDTTLEAQTRLKAGGTVADVDDYPVAAYAAKTTDGGNAFESVGDQIEAGPYGIAVGKTDTKLRDAIQAAVTAIIKDGTYATIIKKWGVEAGSLTEAKINGGS
jgi:polar amino acid transport system substrate-binding protein